MGIGVYTFPRLISPKVNEIAPLEFEFVYYDVAALHISHFSIGTSFSFAAWSIPTEFESFLNRFNWLIDETLKSNISMGQSEPGSNRKKYPTPTPEEV